MIKRLALAACFAGSVWGAALAQTPAPVGVQVSYPVANQEVDMTITAEGKSSPAAKIWIIVHPTATEDYYVQPPAAVAPDGYWSGKVYFGRPNLDKGARFEMQAVANPVEPLKEGLVLRGFPAAAGRSTVIRGLVRR
jgi:hypothetical protein